MTLELGRLYMIFWIIESYTILRQLESPVGRVLLEAKHEVEWITLLGKPLAPERRTVGLSWVFGGFSA